MTIKKFLLLGSVLAGGAVLASKDRRDRLLRAARDFLDSARKQLEERRGPIDIGSGPGRDVGRATDAVPPPPP